MFRITPDPFSTMSGSTACEHRNGPFSVIATSLSQAPSLRLRKSASVAFAALLISTSTGPNASRVASTMSLTSDASVTSVVCARESPPASRISSATATARPLAISATTTAAPSSAKRFASTRPSPEPPPVTMTTLFSNRIPTSRSPLSATTYSLRIVEDSTISALEMRNRRGYATGGAQTRRSASPRPSGTLRVLNTTRGGGYGRGASSWFVGRTAGTNYHHGHG